MNRQNNLVYQSFDVALDVSTAEEAQSYNDYSEVSVTKAWRADFL